MLCLISLKLEQFIIILGNLIPIVLLTSFNIHHCFWLASIWGSMTIAGCASSLHIIKVKVFCQRTWIFSSNTASTIQYYIIVSLLKIMKFEFNQIKCIYLHLLWIIYEANLFFSCTVSLTPHEPFGSKISYGFLTLPVVPNILLFISDYYVLKWLLEKLLLPAWDCNFYLKLLIDPSPSVMGSCDYLGNLETVALVL